MYFDRDRIQTERESQTKELTDRVTKLPGRKKTAQEAATEEAILPYGIPYNNHTDHTDFVQLSYIPYGFRTAVRICTCGRPYNWLYSHAKGC